jgi:hypothetical protein
MKSKLKEMWDKASSVERSYYELQEKEALRLAGIDTQNSHGKEITHNYNNSDINTIGVKRHSEENNDIVCRNDDQKRRKFYSSFAFFVREYLPVVEKELGRDVEVKWCEFNVACIRLPNDACMVHDAMIC